MKPNIIYILTDDLGYGDLSCYGAKHFSTPHLDKLAQSGMRFTDAHSPSAVCTPTRYGILTGRYCFRSRLKSGVLSGHSEPLIEQDRMTVAGYLKSHDYKTYMVGKWHLGLGWGKNGEEFDYSQPIWGGPVDHGFDYYYGISASLDMPPYCYIENKQVVSLPTEPKQPLDFSQGHRGGLMSPGWDDEKVNETFTEKAVQLIEQHAAHHDHSLVGQGSADSGTQSNVQPFFLYLSLTGPHTPWKPAKAFQGKSGIGPRGDLILEIDWTMGELLKTLERLNMREDTMIVFTSDNGPHPCQEEVTVHGHAPAGELRGQKSDIWDGGHRVPYIVSWPAKITAGVVSDQLICLTDLMATCAAILGDELPDNAGEDSVNHLQTLLYNRPARESVVLHSLKGMFSLRKGEWKYIEGQAGGGFPKKYPNMIGLPPEGWTRAKDAADGKIVTDAVTKSTLPDPAEARGQLYRMDQDLAEKQNVYDDYPHIVQELAQELHQIIDAGRD